MYVVSTFLILFSIHARSTKMCMNTYMYLVLVCKNNTTINNQSFVFNV